VTDSHTERPSRSFAFGPFVLIPKRQLLLQGEVPVRIGGRALDLLTALVERPGELVKKRELMARAWPNIIVDESNLKVNMAALRRALNDGPAAANYIATVTGRGYKFVAPVHIAEPPSSGLAIAKLNHNLPTGTTRVFGRTDVISAIRRDLDRSRLVSVVGAGGIGKTTVALAVAEQAIGLFRDGVWLVDLARLKEPELVPNAIATAIGLVAHSTNVLAELGEYLRHREMLLVLDNCEHVIDAASASAHGILASAAGLKILVTSREALLVQGERVRRLPGLGTPPHAIHLKAEDALTFAAVQLFVDRTTDRLESFELSDAEAPIVADICRKLDGLALAIEIAATRVDAFGVSGLSKRLDDLFRILVGHRAASERHRTLAATLDWSYGLLSRSEASLLRAVSVFAGVFELDGASAVSNVTPAEAAVALAELVSKSLLSVDVDGENVAYRLLETTRAYCLDKLHLSGDHPPTARRHAEYFRDFFTTFDLNTSSEGAGYDLARYTREIDNLRAALTWAFSSPGDICLGGELAAAAVNFWLATSMLDECAKWTGKALSEVNSIGDADQEMALRGGLGQSLMFTEGMTPATRTNLTRALSLAEAVGSIEHQKRAAHSLWQISLRSLDLREALQFSRRYAELANSGTDPTATRTANLMVGMSLVYVAEYVEASRMLERAADDFSDHSVVRRRADTPSLGINPRAAALGHLSPCLFARGLVDAAIRAAEQSIEEAQQVGHPVALCLALARPGALLYPEIGALDIAERHVAAIQAQTEQHALPTFRALAICAKGRLLSMRGDPAAGVPALRSGIAQFKATGYRSFETPFRGYFAEALAAAGHVDEGLAEIETAVRIAEQTDYMEYLPELLCIQGRLIALRRPVDPTAEQILLRATRLAGQQQALYWELRAAFALAEIWQTEGRRTEVHSLLSPIYARFTEGLTTPILVRSNALLQAT
jgi:non-specific serine/threonine protein kinase